MTHRLDHHVAPQPVRAHSSHDTQSAHATHGGHAKHAGHDLEMFRRRFWLTLLVSVPVIATSGMIMD